jgi:Ubiquitin carboxyl-terminal hydrolase
MYLSVPIPHKRLNDFPPTLEECIEAFTREEILEGENAWSCPNCMT